MKNIFAIISVFSLFVMGDANAGLLGFSIVAHSSGALILTGSSGYVAGSMAALSAAGPIGWVGAGLLGAAIIIF